jgi:predicted P-loop ATPase
VTATAAEIAAALGDARADGKDWRCRCPKCGNANLTLSDGRRGLLIKCFNDCTSKAVRSKLQGQGLLNGAGNGNTSSEPESRAQHEARAATAAAKRKIRSDAALDIWRNSYPAGDTLCETYLYSRLLMGPVPPALCYVPSFWHKEAGSRYAALIGLVEHADKGAVGIHAVFLNPFDASVRVTIEPRKKSLGPVNGGAVRLAPVGPTLAIAEGIEDALAFMQATNIPCWAAVTAPGLRSFIPPPLGTSDTIILVEDQDANGTGQKAVADAARRLAKKGYTVKIARPTVGKDVNEALLKLGLHEGLVTIEDYPASGASSGDWYSRCIPGSDGRTLSNLANTLLALREDRTWKGMLVANAMLGSAMLARRLPARHHHQEQDALGGPYPRPIVDEDVIAIQEWLQLAGLPHVGKETVHHAVELVALEHSFHPVKQYLDALTWDHTKRLDDWLTDYFGVEKTEYAMAVGRMFVMGMVARIYQPGCQADYMLILEGRQGLKKSTACRILAGEWFSDSLTENVASKDAALHLRGKWLVEVAELHTFNRSETAALKAFITRREDIYRPPYGRKEVYRPRQNLFIGTTNNSVYLKDPTGARRFWPVLTTDIDLDLLKSWRDQLFAEAVASYRDGEHWWPDSDFEITHVLPEQEARFEGDAWEPLIADYLARKPNLNLEHPNGRVTVLDVALNAVGLVKQDVGDVANRRISAVLERSGWRRLRRSNTGRWWALPVTG